MGEGKVARLPRLACVLLAFFTALLGMTTASYTAHAQATTAVPLCTYGGNDLRYLASGLIHKQVDSLKRIENQDLYYFGLAVLTKNKATLPNIKRNTLQVAALALITQNISILQALQIELWDDEDWRTLTFALLKQNPAMLNGIKYDQDLAVLGHAIIGSSTAPLYSLSNKTACCKCTPKGPIADATTHDHHVIVAAAGVPPQAVLAPPYFCCEGLEQLALCLRTADTSYFAAIKHPDLRLLAKALLTADGHYLDQLQNEDMYYFGHALLFTNMNDLYELNAEDLFAVGIAALTADPARLSAVQHPDIRAFGKVLVGLLASAE